ncbi:MAG TPA: MFS transporter [Ktedonobacteraceae bacterium]|nr:MFS transporter [Ktedonobacteraceae bacterium]
MMDRNNKVYESERRREGFNEVPGEVVPVVEKKTTPLTVRSNTSVLSSKGSYRDLLKNRPFLLLWLAQLISQTAFNAANYGVIAVVTEITGSTTQVGIAIISFTLPAIPFSVLAGVYVDMLNKQLVLWVSNALRALAMFLIVLGLLWNPHTATILYILSFITSLIAQFFTPAEAASIPLLVGEERLVSAISLFNITLTLAQVIGFLLLGQLIAILIPAFSFVLGHHVVHVQPLYMLFFVVGICYLICTFLILGIPSNLLRGGEHEMQKPPLELRQMWQTVVHDVRESAIFVFEDRNLFLALFQVTFVSVVLLVIGELAGPFVQNVLHLPVQDLPVVFAPAGVGLILTALLMPRITRRLGKRRTMMIGSVTTGIGFFLLPTGQMLFSFIPILSRWVLLYVAGLTFIMGAALDMLNIPAQTVLQEHTSEDVRGRVFSFQSMLYNAGSIPVILFIGAIADTFGIDRVMYLIGAAILLFEWWATHYRKGGQNHMGKPERRLKLPR